MNLTTTAELKQHGNWSAVYILGLTTFAVVTTEMLPVGLMTPIASALDIPLGTAGYIISVPALLAAFFAPLVIVAAGKIDRRLILAGLLMLLSASNLASALAPSFCWLLLARIGVGFCMGGIWAVAGGLAPRLVPAPSVGTATAFIFGGVAAASVMGVPIGASIGDIMNWRWAFGTMAVFSMIVLILSLLVLPSLPVNQQIKPNQFTATLKHAPIQLGLILTLILVAGHFMAYTFIRPLLQIVSGIEAQWIGALLFLYGAAGIAGNFLAGMFVVQRLYPTLIMIIIGLMAALSGFAFFGKTAAGGIIMLVLWGLAYGGVSVTLQTWMMKASPAAIEIGTALFVSVFNIGIATGAFMGGQIVNHFDLLSNLFIAGALPAAALILTCSFQRKKPK
ncbi:MFS transporter [Brucellaceae bacterium C25G]